MKRRFIVSAAIVLIGLVGFLLFATRETPSPLVPARPAPQAIAVPPAPAPAATTTQATAPAAEAKPGALAFRRLAIDTSKEAPEACLVFSERLREDDASGYRDYLRLTPETSVALRVAADQLCITGLAFGRKYQAELREGLPAASGARLATAETVPVELADQAPLAAFREGLILARDSAGGVPVTTVNIDRLAMRLYRVPDRLVSQIGRERFAERQVYPYALRQIEESQGALLWKGELEIRAPRNQTVTSLFPLREASPQRRPGIYVLTAENAADRREARDDDDYDWRRQTAVQWLVDTDIGLTSFAAADGLHVFARSYRTALPLAGLTLALVARDNDELTRVITDETGHAVFSAGLLKGSGGARAVAVMAYGEAGDFAFQDLGRPAFDLSDRGVEGRALPGPVDAFLYTDRGIYRPGETVHVTTLLRDRAAAAIEATPVTLTVLRPDGAEFRRLTLADGGAGGRHLALELTPTAPRGHWQAVARLDPKGEPVGRVEFDVDDFIPQRLKVELKPADAAIRPGEPFRVAADARFLYGAPAAELDGEAEARLAADPKPFPAFPGYRFGLAQESFQEAVVPMQIEATDAAGHTEAVGTLDKAPDTTLPLRATIRVAIYEPGGRTTEDSVSLPVRTRPLALGIRPLFKGDRVQEGAEAGFEIVALGEEGTPVARDRLGWELVEEVTSYQWYRGDRGWRFERNVRDRTIDTGTLAVTDAAPARFARALSWGYYRLTVHDQATGAATSMRWSAGWRGELSEDRPDKVEVAADKDSYTAGETARIAIRPPVPGEALLVVANDRVLLQRLVHVPAEGATVEIPIGADWGAGAYAVVTHYRPLSQDDGRAPVRAVGVAWLSLDAGPRTLGLELGAPERMRPRTPLRVPVKLANLAAGETAFVTLAAVDEGILQLTKFKTPDPAGWFFGKRRLAVDIRDDYGRLIDIRNTQMAALRQGGDSLGGRGLDVVPTRTVALFSGPLTLDAEGRGEVALDVPDFNGELRLMAVAWTRDKVGAAGRPLTVRDAVIADATLPRFLAPGDESRLALSLHNVEGEAGDYTLRFRAEGPVRVAGETESRVHLDAGERRLLSLPISAGEPGIARIALDVTGPGGFAVAHDWGIQVRGAQLPVARQMIASMAPGEEVKLDAALLDGFIPGSAQVSVGFSSWRGFDIAALLRSLDRYPFGCIEQTTSRAFPLLYFNDLALLAKQKTDRGIQARVQDAVYRVLDMQRASGDFGMWSAGSYPAYGWISVYAVDFLDQAKAKGYVVPEEALARGRRFLSEVAGGGGNRYDTEARQGEGTHRVRAYAFYLLARMGAVNPAELRLFHDSPSQSGPLDAAQLGAALLQIGDRARAAQDFTKAYASLGNRQYAGDYYGSPLRDLAGVTAAAAEAGQSAALPNLVERIGRVDMKDADRLTTQEKSWLLLAANALSRNRGRIAVAIDGKELPRPGDPIQVALDPEQLVAGIGLRNIGEREIWRTVSVEGVPAEPFPAFGNGVTIERRFLTLAGEPADLAQVRQNDRLIVSIEGQALDASRHEFALLDLLPAGWQIEAVLTPDKDGNAPYAFLASLRKPKVREGRDDRFVAAFDSAGPPTRYYRYSGDDEDSDSPNYHVAYLVRATTPGSYTLPAASIEDMYRPDIRARTEMGKVTVLPR